MEMELIKLASSLGVFGLLLFIVVWSLMRGFPGFKTMMETITANHANAISIITVANSKAVDQIATKTEASIAAMSKECRDERKEAAAMNALAIQAAEKRAADERILDRQARHEMADAMQKAVVELAGKRPPVSA